MTSLDLVLWLGVGILLLFCVVVFRGAPYLPSRRKDLKFAFDKLYRLSDDDTLVDIGSGDGVVLRLAASRGARAVGYEINPILVVLSRIFSRKSSKVRVMWRDFWLTHLPPEVTVVYVFGNERDIRKMAERIRSEAGRLGKTIWLMSYAFKVPGMDFERSSGAHFLYKLQPLQSDQP